MKRGPAVAYVRPSEGGVWAYSRLMERVYARTAASLEVETVLESGGGRVSRGIALGVRLARSRPVRLVHAELGMHGATTAWALVVLALLRRPYVVTVHDGGTIVETLFPMARWSRLPKPWCSAANRLRRLLDGLVRKPLIGLLVHRARRIMTMAPGLTVMGRDSAHLPHPLYLEAPPTPRWPERPTVGFAGYWGGAKGIEVLAAAMARLGDPRVALVISGGTGDPHDGYSTSIRELCRQLGLHAEFPGLIPDDAMPAFFASVSVLVIPYLAGHTGLSSGLGTWAMLMGVPILASDHPALRRQLGEHARYFAAGDPVALCVAIRSFLDGPEPLRRLAVQGQRRLYATNNDERLATSLMANLEGIGL